VKDDDRRKGRKRVDPAHPAHGNERPGGPPAVAVPTGGLATGGRWWARIRPIHVALPIVGILLGLPGGPFAALPLVVAAPIVLAAIVLAAAGWPGAAGDVARGRPALPAWAGTAIEAALVAWTVAAFLLFKVAGLHPSGTDDNIYFYLARRLSEGAVPYRDFFFAHPPVHLLIPGAVFGVGGFSIGLAKMIPVTAQMIAAVCLYLAARRTSRGMAVLAVAFHLFAYQVLMGSTDMNGENLMTAFLAAGLLAASRGRYGLAGGLAGLGLGCGLYALAGVLVLGLAAAAGGRRALGRFGLGVLATFGGVCGLFWILGGGAFWDGVVTYHLGKAVRDPDKVPVFASANPFAWIGALARNLGAFLIDHETAKWLYYHLPIVVAVTIAAAALVGRTLVAWMRAPAEGPARRSRRRGPETSQARTADAPARDPTVAVRRGLPSGRPEDFALLGLAAGGLFVLQWAALAETYDFYLVPMWFFLALPAAFAVDRSWTRLRDAGWDRHLAAPAIAGAMLALHPLAAGPLSDRLWPEERKAAGETVSYEWREPWALTALGPVSKALYFQDHRTRGVDEPPWRHALWNKQLTFSSVDEIAAVIRNDSAPDQTVTGASTLAPLVALEAGRRMAGDEADTNGKRFNTGQLSDAEFARRICADKVRWLVASARSHFEPSRLEADPLWSGLFQKHREFTDAQLLHRRGFPITLYRLKDGATLPDGTPCTGGATVTP
jgi:hypothetical protein